MTGHVFSPAKYVVALIAVIFFVSCVFADEGHSRAPAALEAKSICSLAVSPPEVVLKGSDDSCQLIVTGTLVSGKLADLTAVADYGVDESAIIRVSETGRITPLANGKTEVTINFGEQTARASVRVQCCDVSLPVHFANQVVPVFTKLGCNAGGCHGKASGQNGFRLSLLGFDPPLDYETIVLESRGRRVFFAAPEASLLLQKATGTVAHGGGKRLSADSAEYGLIRRWIAAGAPLGKSDDPVVTHISIYPEARILGRDAPQQLAVYAHYSDGATQDVTRLAQYDSNDTSVATVEPSGLLHTLSVSGEAAIMARYQGQIGVFHATVPREGLAPDFVFPEQTLVDCYTNQKWRQLGLAPSRLAGDEQFLRRVSIDITGTLPTPMEVLGFAANSDPHKRAKLIDALLARTDYSFYFGNKWADVLHVKRKQQPGLAEGTFVFHDWLCQAMAADKPYNDFARDILTATGDENSFPPTVWYKELRSPEQLVNDTAQVFLGVRLTCAQCHHHPYEKWGQDDYWSLAAYFGRLAWKTTPLPGGFADKPLLEVTVVSRSSGEVRNKRTGRPAVMRPLGGAAIEVEYGDDPREKLVEWMTDANNPYFARAVVNRYWAHFFGRGLVDPPDDMRLTNPPSNPELLNALAADFVQHGYRLKHLIKTICGSRTYQLESAPNEFNKSDKQTFARHYPRRLNAEVLFDAVCTVTNTPAAFVGLPHDRHAPRRAIMLPDESYVSYFLDVFGRPQRSSACECERANLPSLSQALHLLNSDEVQARLSQRGGRAELLSRDPRPDQEKVEELFLWAFGHPPTSAQLATALAHLSGRRREKKTGYENIIWALLNSKEFVFNQ
jgi:hypothetical protein